MEQFKLVLKYLERIGYPNKNILNLFDSLGYEYENFLTDLVKYLGDDGANDFTMKAINKLSKRDKGVKVYVNEGDYDEYAYIKIHDITVDLDEHDTAVAVSWSWGDTKILYSDEEGKETYVTIQKLYDDAGMGDMGDMENLWDTIKYDCITLVYQHCGFGIWFNNYEPNN